MEPYRKKRLNSKHSDGFLQGEKDSLLGYKLNMLEITDPEVLRKSGQKYHPVLEFSENADGEIEGILLEVTEMEIL